MRRASYREGIAWIAENDSNGDNDRLDTDAVSSLVTTVFLADLFEVDAEKVGKDVIRYRKRMDRAVGFKTE